MAKLYANENFPQQAVDALRELGHDVLTTMDSGNAGQAIPDAAVLAFAKEANRVLVTLNRRHFIRLHNEQPDHAGIIVCTVDADYDALARRVHDTLAAQPDMDGQLVRVNRPG